MILRALGAASTAISIAAGLADASGDGAAFKVWFVAKGTIVIAAVDAFALGVVPHATVFERMARGTEDAAVSHEHHRGFAGHLRLGVGRSAPRVQGRGTMNETATIWIACGVVLLAIVTSHYSLKKAIDTNMAVTQAVFDQDLDTMLTAQTTLNTAYLAKIAALEAVAPPTADLSAEDAQVTTASAALATALAAINPVAAPSAPAAAAAVAPPA